MKQETRSESSWTTMNTATTMITLVRMGDNLSSMAALQDFLNRPSVVEVQVTLFAQQELGKVSGAKIRSQSLVSFAPQHDSAI